MTPIIMLCGLENQAADLHAKACRSVEWAVSAFPSMVPGEPGTWIEHREDGMGYVQSSTDEDGTETIRIRPDAGATDDDVVLVEDPRRNADADGRDPASSLSRWHDAFGSTRMPPIDHVAMQRGQAAMIGAVVDATATGGGRSYVVEPPSLHTSTRILTVGLTNPISIPDEEKLCDACDRLLGHVGWLSVRRTSGCENWEFLAPSSHVFRLPGGGPDPVMALRAHAALEEGPPFS